MLNAVIAIALVKHRVAKTRIWKCESKLQHLKVNQLILSEEWDSQMDNTKKQSPSWRYRNVTEYL